MFQDICGLENRGIHALEHGLPCARAASVAGAEIHGSSTVEVEPPKMHREGALYPRAVSYSTEPSTDQCVFPKRCKLKRRGVFRKIVAGARYHQIFRDKDGGRGPGGGGVAVDEEDEEDLLSHFESEVGPTVHVSRH